MSLPTPTKPSSDGVYKIYNDNFSVTLPSTIDTEEETIELENYFEEIAGRDGLFPVRTPDFLGRAITFNGTLYDEDKVNSLRRVLDSKRVTVERENRILEVDVTSVVITEEVLGKIWRVSIEAESPKYYWRSKDLYNETSSPAVILNEGTLSTFPIFTIVAPEGDMNEVKFEIAGRVAEFTDNTTPVPAGEVLVIDCENLTASTSARSVTGKMNDTFFTDPPRFVPDTNIISVTINDGNTLTPEQLFYDGEPVIFNGQEVYYFPFDTGFEVKYYERFL